MQQNGRSEIGELRQNGLQWQQWLVTSQQASEFGCNWLRNNEKAWLQYAVTARCFIGFRCSVSVRGLNLSTDDTFAALLECGKPKPTETFGNQSLLTSFDSSSNAIVVDLGDVARSTSQETLQLCRCGLPPCSSLEDFDVMAMRLQIVCPAGTFEQAAACQICPADSFCPGDSGRMMRCPARSTSLSGSSSLSDCVCESGLYRSASACVECPAGSTTLGNGATSLSNCTCVPGYVNTNASNPSVCEPCGLGSFWAENSCVACPAGRYKSEIGHVPCTKCPQGRWSSATGAEDPSTCTNCMIDTTTAEAGAGSLEDCLCWPGLYNVNGSCDVCSPGFYCPGTGEALACTTGATSFSRSTSPSDCFCKAGHYSGSGSKCHLCPRGTYKQVQGNAASCPFSCPTNADSEEGSTSLADCFCLPEHFAEVDGGVLTRCTSCAIYTNLLCRGGFHLDPNRTNTPDMPSPWPSHVPPLAKPGFFQTGTVIVVKCTAVLEDGSSACLGGEVCGLSQLLPSTLSVCNLRWGYVGYENQCAEGSTGMLCGECPAFWAKPSLKAPCQKCVTGTFTLILLILADVLLKASINCIVAFMAASAAVKGSDKLHTSIIRIGTQWLAACSVIATFDLEQLKVVSFADQPSEEPPALFAWPREVARAMQTFFDSLTLTPSFVSMELATKCAAQQWYPESVIATRMASGIYHLCSPLLLIIGIFVCSSLMVYLLVPCARRFQVFFNEAAKRNAAKATLVSKLHDMLSQNGLSWDDLEHSGALDVSLARLQEALQQPEGFFRQVVLASPRLFSQACKHRAGVDLEQETKLSEVLEQLLLEESLEEPMDLSVVVDEVISRAAPDQNRPETRALPGSEDEPKTNELQIVDVQLSKENLDLDSLDFGLFSSNPTVMELVYQSTPIIWVGLLSLWPGLLSTFLQMLWCVPILEDGKTVNRLLPSPDIVCWSDTHMPSAAVAIAGLLLWCFGIPVALALRLTTLADRQSPDNYRKYGYFIQGFEPRYW
eukprot:Skav216726  [mRNA]  locus=scaffold653:86735:90308:+ [translate_table: standard]